MYQRRIFKAYLAELGGSLLLYAALLVAAIRFAPVIDDRTMRTLLLVSPMIGFCLVLWSVGRHIGRLDEYVRRVMLESIALGAAITAGLTVTYGFLESAGFPRLSMFVVWSLLCGATGLAYCTRRILQK
jgi:hypothetical protein